MIFPVSIKIKRKKLKTYSSTPSKALNSLEKPKFVYYFTKDAICYSLKKQVTSQASCRFASSIGAEPYNEDLLKEYLLYLHIN